MLAYHRLSITLPVSLFWIFWIRLILTAPKSLRPPFACILDITIHNHSPSKKPVHIFFLIIPKITWVSAHYKL
jgi:hypothetical protein